MKVVETSRIDMEWISVKNEHPKDDQTVFAIHSKFKMLPHKCYYVDEYDVFIDLEGQSSTPLSVTHWMPLPEPPKD